MIGSQKLRRFGLAQVQIISGRVTGRTQSMEEICAEHDLTVDEYWETALCERMGALEFERFLLEELLSPKCDKHGYLELEIRGALRDARNWQLPCCIETPGAEGGADDLHGLSVKPRELIQWLLNNPKREHLVQPMLRAFIDGRKAPTAQAVVLIPKPAPISATDLRSCSNI